MRLEDALKRGELGIPFSGHGLRSLGLESLVSHAPTLSGLGRDAARLLVTAVLRDRGSRGRRPELVWTGPETKQSGARDTAVVLSDLFSSAQQSVLIAGFVFDHGATVLSALHQAMQRGVNCRLFADGDAARHFRRDNWPFGPPFPEVFRFVPAAGVFASLHAKCVVVDHHLVFVTSANFTDRGQNRNIEVGVLLHDENLAAVVEGQFSSARCFVEER
ncbi:MAG: DISARM system phospholipase D-like protein DrmC [Archangium sp.]|nr:DISARM system phospholipase D-like protein DrmC [Archangium sp.]